MKQTEQNSKPQPAKDAELEQERKNGDADMELTELAGMQWQAMQEIESRRGVE